MLSHFLISQIQFSFFTNVRQKKLCGEEDCERCGNQDMDQPCIGSFLRSTTHFYPYIGLFISKHSHTGKTDCSICHSSNGVLCRACLKVRYGEGKPREDELVPCLVR